MAGLGGHRGQAAQPEDGTERKQDLLGPALLQKQPVHPERGKPAAEDLTRFPFPPTQQHPDPQRRSDRRPQPVEQPQVRGFATASVDKLRIEFSRLSGIPLHLKISEQSFPAQPGPSSAPGQAPRAPGAARTSPFGSSATPFGSSATQPATRLTVRPNHNNDGDASKRRRASVVGGTIHQTRPAAWP